MLSATAQLYARVEKLFTLPPGAFSPPPKVHSSVLRLTIDPQQEKLGVARRWVHRFSAAFVWTEAQDAVEQLERSYEEAELKRALGGSQCQAYREGRDFEPGRERGGVSRLAQHPPRLIALLTKHLNR